ncbi:MAG: DUF1573 domain-containing protein [bacterium]
MKKAILGLSALCMVAFTSCKKDAASKVSAVNVTQAEERETAVANADFPVMTFDRAEHDFGEIENGTPVETVFTYTNSGKAPLVISDIKSTCGCTVPQDWSKEPLAPGESGKFTVKFNGKGKNKVTKTVNITANTEKGKEQVKITAFVKADPNAPANSPNAKLTAQPAVNN